MREEYRLPLAWLDEVIMHGARDSVSLNGEVIIIVKGIVSVAVYGMGPITF